MLSVKKVGNRYGIGTLPGYVFDLSSLPNSSIQLSDPHHQYYLTVRLLKRVQAYVGFLKPCHCKGCRLKVVEYVTAGNPADYLENYLDDNISSV